MERTNDAATFNPADDIFETSSPYRAITSHGEPMQTDTLDEALHSNNVVNFSRKRGPHDRRNSYDEKDEHGSKRQRHANWPVQADNKAKSPGKDQLISPVRESKFKEGSMHDRASKKPPSMFTRHFNKHVSMSVDDLMDEYHKDNDKPLPPFPSSQTPPKAARSPGHKKSSRDTRTSHSVDPAASIYSAGVEDARGSGIFKFGKSVATAFNPLNVWSKFTTGWRTTKEELVEEAGDAQKREMLERQKRAAQAYAELKQAGKLGMQGSYTVSSGPVFTPGYTQPVKESNSQRDSGISMGDASRTSVDTSKGSFLFPPEDSPQKYERHGRTRSFHNLKKMASNVSLHRRSASSSRSPEKKSMEDDEPSRTRRSLSRGNILELFGAEDAFGSLRGSKSKNNLLDDMNVDEFGSVRSKKGAAQQVKLTKRVSDLEAKLNSARRELDRARGVNAPPVPVFSPPSVARRSLPRPNNNRSDSSRGFVPALPTLLSESLLVQPGSAPAEPLLDDARTVATADVFHSEDEPAIPVQPWMKEEALGESNGNTLYMQQNLPLLKGEFENSPPAKEKVPGTPGSVERALPNVPQTPDDSQTFFVSESSPHTDMPKKAAKTIAKKASAKKKRASKEDRGYRPKRGDSADDDAEWEEARPNSGKKKRKSDEGVEHSPKRARSTRLPVATESPKGKAKKNVLTKTAPAQKVLPPVPIPTESHTGLETVHEEVSFTNTIPVKNGSPRKPTAKATPAFPHHNHYSHDGVSSSPSRSPVHSKSKLGFKNGRKVLTPKRGRDSRSVSPPPSSSLGKFLSVTPEKDVAMMGRPNGRDVPAMPMAGQMRRMESKSSFEWPEDVF